MPFHLSDTTPECKQVPPLAGADLFSTTCGRGHIYQQKTRVHTLRKRARISHGLHNNTAHQNRSRWFRYFSGSIRHGAICNGHAAPFFSASDSSRLASNYAHQQAQGIRAQLDGPRMNHQEKQCSKVHILPKRAWRTHKQTRFTTAISRSPSPDSVSTHCLRNCS